MTEKLIGIQAAAEYLGIPKSTLYVWTCRKKIPCIRISSRMLRFRLSELEAWLQSKTQGVKEPQTQQPVPTAYKLHKQRQSGANNNLIDALVESARREVIGNESAKV